MCHKFFYVRPLSNSDLLHNSAGEVTWWKPHISLNLWLFLGGLKDFFNPFQSSNLTKLFNVWSNTGQCKFLFRFIIGNIQCQISVNLANKVRDTSVMFHYNDMKIMCLAA